MLVTDSIVIDGKNIHIKKTDQEPVSDIRFASGAEPKVNPEIVTVKEQSDRDRFTLLN